MRSKAKYLKLRSGRQLSHGNRTQVSRCRDQGFQKPIESTPMIVAIIACLTICIFQESVPHCCHGYPFQSTPRKGVFQCNGCGRRYWYTRCRCSGGSGWGEILQLELVSHVAVRKSGEKEVSGWKWWLEWW